MSEPRYIRTPDSQLGLDRWQVLPGQRLLFQHPHSAIRHIRVVAIGGGTGVPVVLRGLKAALFPPGWIWVPGRDGHRLTAIVTVADDGGSSGRLRQTYRLLAPGDIRNCLLALSHGDAATAALFDFRFEGSDEIGGHSLGNLILMALSQVEGGFLKAVERASEMLAIRGRVLPPTLDDVTLFAEFADGSCVRGESRIASARRPIQRVRMEPETARAVPQAVEAVEAADLVVLGPGSLYTSLIPNLLVKQLADALGRTRGRVVLVMNLMTEPGETDGYTGVDCLAAIGRHAPQVPIHDVLINRAPIPCHLIDRYAAEAASLIAPDIDFLRGLGCRPVERDLLGTGPTIRHDPHKLAQALLDLVTEVAQ